MTQQFKEQCKCHNGKIYCSCEKCNEGLFQETKTLEMYLTPEMGNGYRYVFRKEGDQIHGSPPFDFVVILALEKHDVFTVEGSDLLCTKMVNLKQALCGFNFTLNHPSGEDIRISCENVTKPGSIIVMPGKGIGDVGFLKVKIDVSFPDVLTEEQKNILSSCL
jgi:DnaJ-class molecular chaperone